MLVTQIKLDLANGSKNPVRLAAVLTLAFLLLLAGCTRTPPVVPPQATATAVPPPAGLPAPGTALPEPTAQPSVSTPPSKTPATLTTPAARVFVMVGLPYQTHESLGRTASFLRQNRPQRLHVKAFQWYPGIALSQSSAPDAAEQAAFIRTTIEGRSTLWRRVARRLAR